MRPVSVRRRTARRGQAMIEFTLSLPLLLLVMVGVMEITRMISVYTLMTEVGSDAARAWSRLEFKAEDGTQIQAMVRAALEANDLDPSAISVVTQRVEDTTLTPSLYYKVVFVEYQIQPIAPLRLAGYTIADPSMVLRTRSCFVEEAAF